MDDDDDWSLPAADYGSIAQLTEGRVRKTKRKTAPEPIGFIHFEKPDLGVRVGAWSVSRPLKRAPLSRQIKKRK